MLHVDPALNPRHLEDLKFAEQFTVWALRAWVHNSQRAADAVEIETGFPPRENRTSAVRR